MAVGLTECACAWCLCMLVQGTLKIYNPATVRPKETKDEADAVSSINRHTLICFVYNLKSFRTHA
jgi:hypothetical protein